MPQSSTLNFRGFYSVKSHLSGFKNAFVQWFLLLILCGPPKIIKGPHWPLNHQSDRKKMSFVIKKDFTFMTYMDPTYALLCPL